MAALARLVCIFMTTISASSIRRSERRVYSPGCGVGCASPDPHPHLPGRDLDSRGGLLRLLLKSADRIVRGWRTHRLVVSRSSRRSCRSGRLAVRAVPGSGERVRFPESTSPGSAPTPAARGRIRRRLRLDDTISCFSSRKNRAGQGSFRSRRRVCLGRCRMSRGRAC